ncbi:MAG: exopolysaccharide biosynthesis protein exod [Betaproteobacteria bacterium HGW-Betaproteobacteria-8]|nr:MAG: exopolysaccharide biosynthesis protein exod [Betaproteobacteria bacterium HGW-Betaproteobacteria-8]
MNDYERLVATLSRFEQEAKHKPLTLGEALDSLDGTVYALISLILVIPFVQPVPLGPITVLGGITFIILGWQMWRGHSSPVLPKKIRNVEMSENSWRMLGNTCLKIVNFCHKFTKPRMFNLVEGRQGQKIGGMILMASGSLMAIPFGVLPLNNSLPGLAILFFCFGDMESDGLMTVIAFGWIVVTILYFTAFFIGLYFLGNEVFEYLKF